MKTLTRTKQTVENARQAILPQQCAKLGGKVPSANFPHSLSRMCNHIPTVRMQSRPLTHNFQFLIPLMKQIRHLHCCGLAVTYSRHLNSEESLSSLPLSSWAQQWCLNLFHSLNSNYNHQAYKLAYCVQRDACPLSPHCIVKINKTTHVTNQTKKKSTIK